MAKKFQTRGEKARRINERGHPGSYANTRASDAPWPEIRRGGNMGKIILVVGIGWVILYGAGRSAGASSSAPGGQQAEQPEPKEWSWWYGDYPRHSFVRK